VEVIVEALAVIVVEGVVVNFWKARNSISST
jgi:hypothetical protein